MKGKKKGTKHIRKRTRVETQLPHDLQEELNKMLLDGVTYEKAAEWCAVKGFDISTSSVGRYGRDFFEKYKKFRQFEDQMKIMQSDAGSDGVVLDEIANKVIYQSLIELMMKENQDISVHH